MSTSLARLPNQMRRVRRQETGRRRKIRRHHLSTMQPAAIRVEDVYWRQFEEREDGRLAQEADHLFDTSFAWAA
jgi:hypothetical protein